MQRDLPTDPNRIKSEDLAADRIYDEPSVGAGTMAAIIIAAMVVLGVGLSFLTPAEKTAQTTNPPSASDRVTTPPVGTTGQAPR